jgi:hypothetical protein
MSISSITDPFSEEQPPIGNGAYEVMEAAEARPGLMAPKSAECGTPEVTAKDAAITVDPEGVREFIELVWGGMGRGIVALLGYAEKGMPELVPDRRWIDTSKQSLVEHAVRFVEDCARTCHAAYCIPGFVARHGGARAADVTAFSALCLDIDSGDIARKQLLAVGAVGPADMIVRSGGMTASGESKVHLWWTLSSDLGRDVPRIAKFRGDVARKVGGDSHFASPHQPIRIPGSLYRKGGVCRLATIVRPSLDKRSTAHVDHI